MILGFVGGHIVGGISAPIALAEAMFPDRAREPWLGWPALAGVSVLWALGAWAVLTDLLHNETFRPSPAQIIATLAVVVAFILAALDAPRRPRNRTLRRGHAPSPAAVLGVSLLALAVRPLLDSMEVGSRAAGGWPATLAGLAVLIAFAILLARWSSAPDWGPRHVLAVTAGALTAIGAIAFTVQPVGHVPPTAKYVTNTVLLLLLFAVLTIAEHRQRAVGRTQP